MKAGFWGIKDVSLGKLIILFIYFSEIESNIIYNRVLHNKHRNLSYVDSLSGIIDDNSIIIWGFLAWQKYLIDII